MKRRKIIKHWQWSEKNIFLGWLRDRSNLCNIFWWSPINFNLSHIKKERSAYLFQKEQVGQTHDKTFKRSLFEEKMSVYERKTFFCVELFVSSRIFVGAICGADTKQTNTTSVFAVIIKRKSRDFIETLFLTPGNSWANLVCIYESACSGMLKEYSESRWTLCFVFFSQLSFYFCLSRQHKKKYSLRWRNEKKN